MEGGGSFLCLVIQILTCSTYAVTDNLLCPHTFLSLEALKIPLFSTGKIQTCNTSSIPATVPRSQPWPIYPNKNFLSGKNYNLAEDKKVSSWYNGIVTRGGRKSTRLSIYHMYKFSLAYAVLISTSKNCFLFVKATTLHVLVIPP